jgi:hypothetical protein
MYVFLCCGEKIHREHRKHNICSNKISFTSQNILRVPYGTICMSRVLRDPGSVCVFIHNVVIINKQFHHFRTVYFMKNPDKLEFSSMYYKYVTKISWKYFIANLQSNSFPL